MTFGRQHGRADQAASRSGGSPWLGNGARWLLVSLPVLTIGVITLAIFVLGAPASYSAARVWGGPVQGVQRFSLRMQAVERYRDLEQGVASTTLVAELSLGSSVLGRASCATDSAGFCEASFQLVRPVDAPPNLRVHGPGRSVAEGRLALSRREWLARARRRGGWVQNSGARALTLRLHPGRGVLAVPFRGPIVIQARLAGQPLAGARLELEPEGLVLSGPAQVLTGDQGQVSIWASPREHVVSLGIKASHGDFTGKLYTSLPVVPGAMHAMRDRDRLVIESPIARDAAFYSIVNEQTRLAGGRVLLASDGKGGARASIELPGGLEGPLWAVVASEPDLNTQAAVGWPLDDAGPATTLDVPDRLLLDGLPAAYERSLERPRRARWLAGLFALFALALAVVLFVGRVHATDRQIERHFRETLPTAEGHDRLKQSALVLAAAVLCIALGFVLLGMVSLMRVG